MEILNQVFEYQVGQEVLFKDNQYRIFNRIVKQDSYGAHIFYSLRGKYDIKTNVKEEWLYPIENRNEIQQQWDEYENKLDMYEATGEKEYKNQADEILDNLKKDRMRENEGN